MTIENMKLREFLCQLTSILKHSCLLGVVLGQGKVSLGSEVIKIVKVASIVHGVCEC